MKRYTIAHTLDGMDMTIETFYSPEKAVKRISEVMDYERKALPTDCPEEFLKAYYTWVREENHNETDIEMTLEIADIVNKGNVCFLFGERACKFFDEHGADKFVAEYDDELYGLWEHDHVEFSVIDFANAMNGYLDFSILNKEEFDKLSNK